MPGPRIRAAKENVNARTGNLVDMSFDSNYNLNKIARVINAESNTAVAHGLPYAPKILAMREVAGGKFGHGALCGVDGTNIYPDITTEGDDAAWVTIMIDPLSAGAYKKDMKGKPVILVGKDTGTDYDYKLHSGYDTFKVFTTGTLTITAPEYNPGPGGGTETRTATFNHGLGYVPMFAPFVQYETSLESYYQWNGQYNSRNEWATSTVYYVGEDVTEATYTDWWTCKLTHTSSAATQPGVGANWQTYWSVYQDPDFYNTYVNRLEDIKYVYGGVEFFNESTVRYYATSTQLVLELQRYNAPTQDPFYEQTPSPAETVSVDYTLFYNPANEEFNLL